MRCLFVLFLLFNLCHQTATAQQLSKPLLLKNVRHLPLPDAGHLIFVPITFSDTAENIAVANVAEGAPIDMNVIVSSRLGKGKIIVFGSAAYLRKELLVDTGVHQLAQNMLRWAGAGHKRPKMGIYTAADS